MRFKVTNYTCGIDAEVYGFKGKGTIILRPFWDAPVNDPHESRFWRDQKQDMLAEIEYLIKERRVIWVAVFASEAEGQDV